MEIEDHLRAHRSIKDAAVIGLPDRRLGEVPVAVVELKPGEQLDEESILSFCDDLPRYKRPHQVFFDNVPRNPTGKIETKLRQQYCEAGQAQVV